MKTIILLFTFFIFSKVQGQSTLCYNENRKSEKGYIGQINGIKLFYEVWNVNSVQGMHYTSLFLRTDTSGLDSIDFCFDMEHQTDSIYITKLSSDTTFEFVTLDSKQIPSLFQTLIRAEYTIDHYYSFNNSHSSQKILIENDRLYLIYVHSPRFEKAYLMKKIYNFANGQFKLIKTTKKIL